MEEMTKNESEAQNRIKKFGFAMSVLLLIIGASLIFVMQELAFLGELMLFFGIVVKVFTDVMLYFMLPKGVRDVSDITGAAVWTALALIFVISSFSLVESIKSWVLFDILYAFIAGFTGIFGGVKALGASGNCDNRRCPVAARVVVGILAVIFGAAAILVGAAVITYHKSSVITNAVLYGSIPIVGGVSLACRVLLV